MEETLIVIAAVRIEDRAKDNGAGLTGWVDYGTLMFCLCFNAE